MIDLGREPDYRGRWNQSVAHYESSPFTMYILKRKRTSDSEKISGLIVDDVLRSERDVFSTFSGEMNGKSIHFQKIYEAGAGGVRLSYRGDIDDQGNIRGIYRSGAPGIRGTFDMSPVKQKVESVA